MDVVSTLLTGGIKEFIQGIVGTFKLSPEAKLEFDKQLAENEFRLKAIDAELEGKLADTASANLRAESGSGDKYVSRARPTFLYIMNFILLWNYVVVPIFKQNPVTLPEPLFWLFGSVMLGYVGARSMEKYFGKA